MSDKINEQLEDEIKWRDRKDSIFKEGHGIWASKLTEKIVFSLCAIILTGAVVALLNLIFIAKK